MASRPTAPDLPRFLELAPEMLFGQTVGSGHFCQLEVPDQVGAMVARFLTVLPSLQQVAAGAEQPGR